MKLIFCLITAAALLLAQPPEPDDAAKKKIVDDARVKALQYVKELPAYECNQITRRNIDVKGTNQWKEVETTNEILTFADQKEQYRVVAVNGKKSAAEKNRSGTSISSTEFTNIINWTFAPDTKADITWSQWDTLRGHRVHALGFRVPKETSKLTIGKGKNQLTVGYFGIIDIDADSGAILKMGYVATDVPPKFPVSVVNHEYHWEFAKVGDHYYVLPLKADLHSKDGKSNLWNEVEFRDYRKPGAEATAAAK